MEFFFNFFFLEVAVVVENLFKTRGVVVAKREPQWCAY